MRKLMTIAAMVAISALVASCSSGGSGGTGADESHLNTVISSKTLRVGIIPDNPPSSIRQGTNDWKGYDVDLAQFLADSLGAKLEIVSTTGADRVTVLETNKADVVISTFTPTNERAQKIAFTIPYSASGTVPMFPEGAGISTFDDVAKHTVAFARGSTADLLMQAKFPDAKVERFDNIADAFQALKSGKVEVLLEDNQIVAQLMKDNPGYATVDEDPQNLGYLSMGVPIGDQVWTEYLNNFIRNFNVSGDNNALYQKWFNAPLPALYGY